MSLTRPSSGLGLAGTGCLALSHQYQEVLISQKCVTFKVGSGNAGTQAPLPADTLLTFPKVAFTREFCFLLSTHPDARRLLHPASG